MIPKPNSLFLVYLMIAACILEYEVAAAGRNKNKPGQSKPPERKHCTLSKSGPLRCVRSTQDVEEMTSYGTENEYPVPLDESLTSGKEYEADRSKREAKTTFKCNKGTCTGGSGFPPISSTRSSKGFPQNSRFRRSAARFDDKGFRDFTPDTNTRGMIHSSKTFGPNSHGGWQSSAKLEHDFWKSNDGNHRVSGFVQHDRIDGGRFDGFKDTRGGVGYQGRFRRSAAGFDDKGFKDFTPYTNTRGMIHSSKDFGPNSHGGWQSSAKLEHDFWKSNDGNHKISGFVQHDRIDGGRFDGFKDTRGGVGYQGRFRRSAAGFDDKGFKDFTPYTNTRGMIHSSKDFGPNSHGGWQSSAKLEHDFWKSNDGNHRISGFVQHDRIDGGRFDGFKDTKGGIGYEGRFRRSISEDEGL